MSGKKGSRRDFLGAAVAAPAVGAMALTDPGALQRRRPASNVATCPI